MPPRSNTDRDEHSMRRECWDSTSCEIKEQQDQGRAQGSLLTATTPSREVKFAPTAKVRQFTKFTKDQAKDIWFVNEDFTKMKRSFAPTVQRMMNGTLTQEEMQGEEHCIRGLEYRTKDGARRRMKNKFNGMAAVLHEQDRQVFEEKDDPERLAAVYSEVNAHCMEEAIALGRQDELDIQEYMASDNEPFYDAAGEEATDDASVASTASRGRLLARTSPRSRKSKLKHSGSFHERSIRGLKRIFSGKKMRSRSQGRLPGTVVSTA